MRNFPLLETNVKNVEDIFGKMTTNQKSMQLRSYITNIPITILKKYQLVMLTNDIMFVNGIRFIITKSRAIKFIITQFISSAKKQIYINQYWKLRNSINIVVLM